MFFNRFNTNMKKLLLSILLALGFMSCSSNEEIILNEEAISFSELTEKYDSYKVLSQENIAQTYQELTGSKARSAGTTSVTGAELIQLLSSMPKETVDSLYKYYCTPTIEQEFSSNYDICLDELEKHSSIVEVQQFFDFINTYIETGGHNLIMLANNLKGKAPIIQECMIGCAASIDEYLGTIPQSRSADAYCLHQLSLKMAESAFTNELISIVADASLAMIAAPGADVALGLCLAGYDLYSSLKMAHDYNMCCATHVS